MLFRSNETESTFFAINEFHFRYAECARAAFSSIARANVKMSTTIEIVSFRFYSENATTLYPQLAKACPNVRVLRVMMNYGDKHAIIKPPNRSLKKARGVSTLSRISLG